MFERRFWGDLPDGRQAELITLTSSAGAVVDVSNFGGIIRSLTIPLADGSHRQVVLGYDSLAEYMADTCFVGVTIGPYANRIRGGQFMLDGVCYDLEKNEGGNTLHSGSTAWHTALYDDEQDGDALVLKLHSPDGAGGFPGNVDVSVRFFWQDPMTFAITYQVMTDKATVFNMTHHSYFNLGTEDTILSHILQLRADRYVSVDADGLPTGKLLPVRGTIFDFQTPRPIARHYDSTFVLTGGPDPAVTLTAPDGKLSLDVFTDKPGVQVYTGTYLQPPFVPYGGVCLETQHFPDAPNIPAFPSPVVRPGEWYQSTTAFQFTTDPYLT